MQVLYGHSFWNKGSSVEQVHVQFKKIIRIRESVDSLCRDGADVQYMQYLSKSRIPSPQIR